MFAVMLRFTKLKGGASRFMEGHRRWIKQGFADGVLVVAGTLAGNRGGFLLVRRQTRTELRRRLKADPFVAERIVEVAIEEFQPAVAAPRLRFLLGEAR
jgi:uncharacterized protein YciI